MLGDTPQLYLEATQPAQEDIMYHNNLPAEIHTDFYHSHDVYTSHTGQPLEDHRSYTAEESTNDISENFDQTDAMAAPHDSELQRYRQVRRLMTWQGLITYKAVLSLQPPLHRPAST